MNEEVKRKISLVHWLFGAVFGLVTGIALNTTLSFGAVLFLGLLASYPLSILTRRFFNLSAREFALKDWLKSGFLYFFIGWIMVWTFVHNIVH